MNKIFVILVFLFGCTLGNKVNYVTILKNNSQKIYNVKDFGAKGDNKQDDSKAIQKCFDRINKDGGGIAFFPNGIYKVSRTNLPGKDWSIKGINNLVILGENKEKTIIRLEKNQLNFTKILVINNNNNIIIKNITFDGNVNNQKNPKNPNEHLGAIFINSSKNIILYNSTFISTGGDGITIRGVKVPSSNINIENCYFNNNQRNGITLGSGYYNVKILNNIFGKDIDDSPIDSEPESGIVKNVLIKNNIIYTPTIVSIGGKKGLIGDNYVIEKNKFYNCSMDILDANNVSLIENTFILNNPKRPAIIFIGYNDKILINKNVIKIRNKYAFYFVITKYRKKPTSNVTITNNKIFINGKSKAFYMEGAENFIIKNNEIISNSNDDIAIYCFPIDTTQKINIKILDNYIKGFKTGIKIRKNKNNKYNNILLNKNRYKSVEKKSEIK